MATQIESQTKTWGPAGESAAVTGGDILNPLKKLQQKYADKAVEMRSKSHGDNALAMSDAASFYQDAAASLGRLIEN